MICEEERVDLRIPDPKSAEEGRRLAQLAFRLNHTMPMTDEYQEILRELCGDNLGEGSFVTAPILGVCFDRIKIGKNVIINANMLAMARGGITIEDDVQIAANVQLLTNNHDPPQKPGIGARFLCHTIKNCHLQILRQETVCAGASTAVK